MTSFEAYLIGVFLGYVCRSILVRIDEHNKAKREKYDESSPYWLGFSHGFTDCQQRRNRILEDAGIRELVMDLTEEQSRKDYARALAEWKKRNYG